VFTARAVSPSCRRLTSCTRLYNSPTECTTISEFNSFADDTCFHQGNTGFAYQFPNVSFYSDPTCSTEPPTDTKVLPQTCTHVTAWPANTNVASQWSLSDIPFIPTAAPTTQPSAAPTPSAYGKGYLYVDLYENRGCSGAIRAVTGVPTETCLTSYDDDDSAEPTGSMKYTCYGCKSCTARCTCCYCNSVITFNVVLVFTAVSVTQQFSDTECKNEITSVQNDLSCRNIIGRAGSAKGMCNSDDSKLPLPASNFTTKVYATTQT
jgi:hypothetical protein